MTAFSWPLAVLFQALFGSMGAGMMMSSVLQLVAYMLLRRSKLTPKRKLTIAIIWGMGSALVVRVLIAYQLYQAVVRAGLEGQ